MTELKRGNWDGPEIIDFTSQLKDFSDTAALMESLDLLITVDTSTAHLAGSLGKPVFILNRFDTCWRWLLQRTDSPWSQQLGLSPILMAAANSSGGVMGKMIDVQSIVVASTATNWFGHEGSILRFVFLHSIALACLVGVLVMLQAYVFPGMIVQP